MITQPECVSESAGKRILSVEPAAVWREQLRELLAEYPVSFAQNAYEALRSVNAEAVDLYLLDVWLPDWSGPHVCRYIRKIDPHVPIVFWTTAFRDDNQRRAFKAGASAYLQKPSALQQLPNTIRELLEVAEAGNVRAQEAAFAGAINELRRASIKLASGRVPQQAAARTAKRLARSKGSGAFIAAGGTLASFDRWWRRVEPTLLCDWTGELDLDGAPQDELASAAHV